MYNISFICFSMFHVFSSMTGKFKNTGSSYVQRRKSKDTLTPPKPKELERAYSMSGRRRWGLCGLCPTIWKSQALATLSGLHGQGGSSQAMV